jgi:hypothetical protein
MKLSVTNDRIVESSSVNLNLLYTVVGFTFFGGSGAKVDIIDYITGF